MCVVFLWFFSSSMYFYCLVIYYRVSCYAAEKLANGKFDDFLSKSTDNSYSHLEYGTCADATVFGRRATMMMFI